MDRSGTTTHMRNFLGEVVSSLATTCCYTESGWVDQALSLIAALALATASLALVTSSAGAASLFAS